MNGCTRCRRGTTYYAALILTIIAVGAAAYFGMSRENANERQVPAAATPFVPTPTPLSGAPVPEAIPEATPLASPASNPATPEASPTPFLAPATANDVVSLEITTDKLEYFPQDTMDVTVRVNVSRDLPPCFITLQGVTNSFGHDYIYQSEQVPLNAGENVRGYSFQLPSCSSCSGLGYGEHNFSVRIAFNGELLKNGTAVIRMVSRG